MTTEHDDDRFGTPMRAWATKDEDSLMHCYLGMRRRISLRELVDYFAEQYPHVDPWQVQLNFSTATWEEPPTEADHAERARRRADHDARHAKWERETYERLKAKFEAGEATA